MAGRSLVRKDDHTVGSTGTDLALPDGYGELLAEIKERVRTAQVGAEKSGPLSAVAS